MSYRELWVLVQYLPQESWTQTILRDEQHELVNPGSARPVEQKFGPWALLNYQLTALIDAVNENTYVTAVAGNLKNPKRPDPTPRPGRQVRAERRNPDEVVVYLEKIRARG